MKNIEVIKQRLLAQLERELPAHLTYHGVHHTVDVLRAVEEIARYEKVSGGDLLLLQVAVLYHDAGFIETYRGHEAGGTRIAREQLPGFGFSAEEIERVCGMIMATQIPQRPQNLLEEIIADADLDYLGTDDYDAVSATLFEELKALNFLQTEKQWRKVQSDFLRSHYYHTSFAKQFREAKKQEHLLRIEAQMLAAGDSVD